MASNYKRRFGDRKEGRLIRSLPALSRFIPYIMPTRNDACNLYEESFEVSAVDRRLRKLRVDGYKGIGIHFAPTDTIFDVYRKMNEKIEEIKASDENNNTEAVAEAICRLPRILLRLAIQILRIMDYFGWLPESLTDASPFHGSMIITDLGSLRIGPIFHHIYNFGTLPTFIAFGAKRHAYELDRHGNMVDHKYVDLKFTLDERTVDGHYWAQAFQAWRYLFQHPEILEAPPTRVVEDVY